MDLDMKSSIIIDNGSGTMKVGMSGQNKQCEKFSSIVGKLKSNNESQTFVGKDLDQSKKASCKLMYPMKHGIIQNWDQMELIWKYAYSLLKVSPKDHPVLLTEALFNSIQNKKKMLEIFFQKFQVPAVFIAVQGVLSLYGAGQSTGVILDSGDGVTHVIPVYQGFAISHCSQRMDFAGRNVTQHLRNLLRKSGINMDTSRQFQLIKGLKQNFCSISSQKTQPKRQKYTLPDGQVLQLCSGQKQAGEILFFPQKIGLQFPSVTQLLVKSLSKVDIDLKNTLYSEIVLSGGNTMISGFPQKFIKQITSIIPGSVKCRLLAPENRDTLCWQGGNIVSGLETFKHMWISRSQFMQNKQGILHKKKMI